MPPLSSIASSEEVCVWLRQHGINPTRQRVEIARILFERPAHLSTDEVYERVRSRKTRLSLATVYNTLNLFASKGLVRPMMVDSNKVFYDTKAGPHHHFYDTETRRLTNIEADDIEVTGLPALPRGTELQGVEVIVHVRRR